MASKAYEGNYTAWLLETAPTDWEGESEGDRTVTATELDAGTRLERLVSDGAIALTFTTNTASQAKLDAGKVGHNIGTREITGVSVTHERDLPDEDGSDDMWALYAYGDKRYLVIDPSRDPESTDFHPLDTGILHVFEIETGETELQATARDTKQNFMVTFAVQEWDLNVTFDDEVA
ncbi:MAG: hypothetical protein ACOCUN_00160 [Jiangellaceae bacterium]